MKIITKRRNWWKRPLAVMLSATLVASSFSMVGVPKEVRAAAVGPGGVSSVDFVSHVDVGKSAVEKPDNQYVLNDLAGNFEWTHSTNFGNSADAIKGVINYHQAISGKNSVLFVTKKEREDIPSPTNHEREIFSVQKSAGNGFPWEFGENANQGVKYTDTVVTVSFGLTKGGDGPVTFKPEEKVSSPNILNVSTANTNWNLSINGRTEKSITLTQPFDWTGTDDKVYGSEYLGYGSYSAFKDGSIAEMLVFNRKLTNDERQKVNSYLALKYGITLKDDSGVTTDYVASDGSTMWTATNNSGFGHRVTGIGRDENGLLDQKQSKSQADGANVTIALGDVAIANVANTNTINNDLSFFTFSDDNQPADYTKVLTNADLPSQLKHTNTDTKSTKMMERVYKVDKSSNWEDALITLQVDGANPNEFQLYLFTSSDPTFATGVTVTPAQKTTGKAQTNTSFLTDGSYFTFVKYVDKKALETRVSAIDAENLQEASYTSVSWQAFAQALANAKAVLTDADKTKSEVADALTELNAARDGLSPLSSLKSPGGVVGATLWLNPGAGINVSDGDKVSEWQDQSGQNNHATQSDANSQPTYSNNAQTNVNFNPMVKFDGNNYLNLDVNKLPTGKNPRSIVAVAATNTLTGNHYILSWGNASPNQMMGMLQLNTTGTLTGYMNHFTSDEGFWQQHVPNELFGTYDGAVGALYSRMYEIGKENRGWDTGNNGAKVGAMVNGNETWNGTIGDVIVFDKVLNEPERQKLSSYLSIKYGYTLDGVDYLSSSGATVWTANATYKHNIAGIARDDNGSLLQKQSNSTNAGAQVIINVGDLATTNLANTGNLDDGQYLIWGDNGKALTFTKQIGTTNKNHAERIWKVQNTNAVGEVSVVIPKSVLPANASLFVGGSDTDFSTATEYPLTEVTFEGIAYLTTKATIANGHYFTFAAQAPKPTSAVLEQTVAQGNKITLTFDQDVALTIPESVGFTISVGDDSIDLTGATFAVDPSDAKKLVITLPAGTDVTGKEVEVSYNGSGNLKGTNDVPINQFTMDAEDSFAVALKINEPSGDPAQVTKPMPEISGTVEIGSTVDVAIKDGTGATVATGTTIVQTDGTWTFTPSANLESGTYTIEVTATKGSQTAMKTKQMTVVDKTALQAKVAEINGENLNRSLYTTTSWQALQTALTVAQSVLDNPNATQAEVDAAKAALEEARTGLQTVPVEPPPTPSPSVDKSALQAKVNAIKTEALNKSNYTPNSWASFETVLTTAQAVLNNSNATQAEVDAAKAALEFARNGLVPVKKDVDKTALQAKVDAVNGEGLEESAYTPASWSIFQMALLEAESVLANPEATQVEVDAAKAKLDTAYASLVPVAEKVDKTALQAKVNAVNGEGLEESAYTPASWSIFQGALLEAESVLANPEATQAEVDLAKAALERALEQLVSVVEEGVNKAPLRVRVVEIEQENLNKADYTSNSWQTLQGALSEARVVLTDPEVTQNDVDNALAQLNLARHTLVPVTSSHGQLVSLIPGYGNLNPSFSSDHDNYQLTVGNGVYQLPLTTVALDPNATITKSVNGQVVTTNDIPLIVGTNTITIKVTDSFGHVKTYTLTVIRESGSDGGSSGDGGTPSTPSTPTSPTKETIVVDLEIVGDNPLEKTSVTIERTKQTDGRVNDYVALTPNQAQEAVDKAKQIGNNTARITIPDVKDEVDEVKVDISKQSIQTLRENGISLEILTNNARIELPVSSMDGIGDDFYFRLVPIKEESERQEIEERARVEQVVRVLAGNEHIDVVARPMTIETNLSSRPVILTLPLKGVDLPTNEADRQAYLSQLAVFIEHTDGEKKVVFGEIVTMDNGELGIRFSVNKFSTFTIIALPKQEKHEAYIKGFPDGLFKPNEAVTRAQVAAMVARNLGYTGSEQASVAPFKDVAPSHYASGVIRFVKEAGLMTGDPNGEFRPNETITRAEMATIIAKYKQLALEITSKPSFSDTNGHWAESFIEASRHANLVTGYENGSFRPNGSLTRAEAVAMLNRMFERGPLHGVATHSFQDVRSYHWAFNDIEEAAKTHYFYIDENGREYEVK